jgi:hypothetical protein
MLRVSSHRHVCWANTAIEPWPGQARYRAGLEALLLAATAGNVATWLRSVPRRVCLSFVPQLDVRGK